MYCYRKPPPASGSLHASMRKASGGLVCQWRRSDTRDLCCNPSRARSIRVTGRYGSSGRACRSNRDPESGATDIARKPNYDFERREREMAKASGSAKKAQAKVDKRAAEQKAPDADEPGGS